MAAAGKVDLYKEHKHEYITPKSPTLLDVGAARYLAVDGSGAPGGEAFTTHVGALYSVAFTVKMTRKFAGQDYRVCHLEATWWGHDNSCDFSAQPPETWNWKLLIRTPDFITEQDINAAVGKLLAKRKPAEVSLVRLEDLHEGRCVQMLHVGPYTDECGTVEIIREFVAHNGLQFSGRHHEIYLSDPRRVEPERLKTIIRIPVSSA